MFILMNDFSGFYYILTLDKVLICYINLLLIFNTKTKKIKEITLCYVVSSIYLSIGIQLFRIDGKREKKRERNLVTSYAVLIFASYFRLLCKSMIYTIISHSLI